MGRLAKTKKQAELPPTNYYMINTGFPDGAARISNQPHLPPRYQTWMTGRPIDIDIPTPLEYEIIGDHSGTMRHFFQEPGAPLMSTDLINVLVANGVNNLQTFDAIITDREKNQTYTNYKSVNVIGLISAVDLDKSEYTDLGIGGDGVPSNLFFKTLVLDESRCSELLMFRLAEKVSALVIHASIRKAIETSPVDFSGHLVFTHPMQFK